MKNVLKLLRVLIFLPLIISIISCNNRKSETFKNDKKTESLNKLEWFHEAKFGLFIHWGLYSVPAGEWEGEKNHGEWIQYSANIPGAEYEKLAKNFNPVKFNAKDWVTIAKKAGMKYIVITAKHHEGFCMYDSRLTNYDIVDATPYERTC
jgi:alpha-L-fucosidase